MENKCECNEEGVLRPEMVSWYNKETELPFVKHKPNECKCTNELKQYLRDKRKIWLCSCCKLRTDELVGAESENEI